MKKAPESANDADPSMMPIMERYYDKAAMVRNYGAKFLRH